MFTFAKVDPWYFAVVKGRVVQLGEISPVNLGSITPIDTGKFALAYKENGAEVAEVFSLDKMQEMFQQMIGGDKISAVHAKAKALVAQKKVKEAGLGEAVGRLDYNPVFLGRWKLVDLPPQNESKFQGI